MYRAAKDGTVKEKGWAETAYGTSKLGLITLTRIQGADIDKTGKDILINSVSILIVIAMCSKMSQLIYVML